jgi:uncharacterized protein (DUF488 family)
MMGAEPVTVPRLYTIGYERHREPNSLVRALQAAGVERLMDVRELPLSRRRGYSKTALSTTLGEAGIAYEHERALGNPKPLRDLYKSGKLTAGRRGYTTHVRNGSAWAVDELSTSLKSQATCVMCVEHDHRICHRDILVQELRKRLPNLAVVHL